LISHKLSFKDREWLSKENMDINSEGIIAGSTSKINAGDGDTWYQPSGNNL